jgi:hypothetical protein
MNAMDLLDVLMESGMPRSGGKCIEHSMGRGGMGASALNSGWLTWEGRPAARIETILITGSFRQPGTEES